MGNRLTLPLLLLAALLAGGAFFWMTGDERGGAARRGGDEPAPAKEVEPAPAELAAADAPRDEPAPEKPARVELEGAEKEAAPVAKASSGREVQVGGRVVDRFGTPIAGARVMAASDTGFPLDLELERDFPWMRRQRTETDADGRFRFERVEPGGMQVTVRASGFAPYTQRGLAVPAADTELEPLVLTRGAILSGIVVDDEGRPVADARIVPAALEAGPGAFVLGGGEREPSAVTGPDGRFRVDQLACGAWRFLVRSEDHPDLTVEGLAEEPGVEVGGLRWELAPGATIAGTVTSVPAAERGKLEVRAARTGAPDGFFAFGSGRVAEVDESGSFQLRGLDVGASYMLQARRAQPENDYSFWERSRSAAVQARSGDAGVVLAYQPEAAVTFTVLDAATRQPIEKFTVDAGLEWPQPLRDDQGRPRTLFPGGAVRVGGLRPSSDDDRVQVIVKATGYRDLEREDIAVRAGQELDLGSLYLEAVPLVRVRVLDAKSGEPVVGANVRMRPDEGDGFGSRQIRHTISIDADEGSESIDFGDSRSAITDEKGWAELTSYEGQTVELSASAKGYAPNKLGALALPRGESTTQELRLSQGGEVLVTVVDPRGAALAGARVEHRPPGAPGGMMMIGGSRPTGQATDSEGKLVFSNLAAGTHAFRLAEAGGGGGALWGGGEMTFVMRGAESELGDEWSQVQVVEGERVELTLNAPPRSSLTGRVREGGKVLAGATLRLEQESEAGGGMRGMPRLPGMGGGGPEGRSDGDGRYDIADVKEGEYKLVVEHPTRRMPQEFEVALREGENSFDVDLPVSILSGRVVDAAGKGIAGVRVWPERRSPSEGGTTVAFRMVMLDDGGGGGMLDSGQFGERTRTDADGYYTLRGVTSDVDLVVKAEGDAVQPGESEVVTVAPNQTKDGVDLKLDVAGSIRVEASLADGSPARFQLVEARWAGGGDSPPDPKVAFIQQGSTELKGLKPGKWNVSVRQAGPNSPAGQEREVEVLPGETSTQTFEVE